MAQVRSRAGASSGFQYLTVPLARPGGAQGQLLAEVSQHEQQAKLQAVTAEF